MNNRPIIAASSVLAIACAALTPAIADEYRQEFTIELQSGDVANGTSGFGQGIKYTFHVFPVDSGTFPYAETEFTNRVPSVTAAVTGAGGDIANGSVHEWDYSVRGRFALPESDFFGELGYTRLASWFNPFILSSAPAYNVATKVIRAVGGMYVTPSTAVDVLIARSNAEISDASDVTTLAFGAHVKTLLPVTADSYVALDFALTRTSADLDSGDFEQIDYSAHAAWYMARDRGVSLGFGSGIDLDYPLADYSVFELTGMQFFGPEFQLSLNYRHVRWWDNSKDDSAILSFALRL